MSKVYLFVSGTYLFVSGKSGFAQIHPDTFRYTSDTYEKRIKNNHKYSHIFAFFLLIFAAYCSRVFDQQSMLRFNMVSQPFKRMMKWLGFFLQLIVCFEVLENVFVSPSFRRWLSNHFTHLE